jgi:hypothetical protein
MEREAHLQGILRISQKPHLSGSPVKEPSPKVPYMESLAERHPTTRTLLHSSIKVPGIRASPHTPGSPHVERGPHGERSPYPETSLAYLPGSPLKELPPRPPPQSLLNAKAVWWNRILPMMRTWTLYFNANPPSPLNFCQTLVSCILWKLGYVWPDHHPYFTFLLHLLTVFPIQILSLELHWPQCLRHRHTVFRSTFVYFKNCEIAYIWPEYDFWNFGLSFKEDMNGPRFWLNVQHGLYCQWRTGNVHLFLLVGLSWVWWVCWLQSGKDEYTKLNIYFFSIWDLVNLNYVPQHYRSNI